MNSQVKTFSSNDETDSPDDQIFHKCSFCHKLSTRTKSLVSCAHYIHLGCLKMKVISTLISGKYRIYCLDKFCNSQIDRKFIVALISETAKVCYDTLQFLDEYTVAESEKVLYWCYKCRQINCKYIDQNTKCHSCEKRQDKLKNVFTLIKLLLVERESKNKDSKNYEAISKCVEDCKKQLKRCNNCNMWKHSFPGIQLKCLC